MRRKTRITPLMRTKASLIDFTAANADLEKRLGVCGEQRDHFECKLQEAEEANKRLSAKLIDAQAQIHSVRRKFRAAMLQSTLHAAKLEGYIQRLHNTEVAERGPTSVTTSTTNSETTHRHQDGPLPASVNYDVDFREVDNAVNRPLTGVHGFAETPRAPQHWLDL